MFCHFLNIFEFVYDIDCGGFTHLFEFRIWLENYPAVCLYKNYLEFCLIYLLDLFILNALTVAFEKCRVFHGEGWKELFVRHLSALTACHLKLCRKISCKWMSCRINVMSCHVEICHVITRSCAIAWSLLGVFFHESGHLFVGYAKCAVIT